MLVLRSATRLIYVSRILIDIIIENAKAELNRYTIMNCELYDKRYSHVIGDR